MEDGPVENHIGERGQLKRRKLEIRFEWVIEIQPISEKRTKRSFKE